MATIYTEQRPSRIHKCMILRRTLEMGLQKVTIMKMKIPKVKWFQKNCFLFCFFALAYRRVKDQAPNAQRRKELTLCSL